MAKDGYGSVQDYDDDGEYPDSYYDPDKGRTINYYGSEVKDENEQS